MDFGPKFRKKRKFWIKGNIVLYFGIEKKSFFSFTGKKLYRGLMINKKEYENIKQYKKEGKINNIVVFSKAFLSFSEKKDEAKKFIGKPYGYVLGVLYVLDNLVHLLL